MNYCHSAKLRFNFLKVIALIIVTCSICLSTAILAKESEATHVQVFLSKGTNDNQPGINPQSTFLCTDTIYAILDGNWPRNTDHKFEAYWINPQGEQQEHSRHKFKAYGDTRAWIWFRLHRGGDNAMSRFFGISDDSMQEFVGNWKVDFYLDGKKVFRSQFNVAC